VKKSIYLLVIFIFCFQCLQAEETQRTVALPVYANITEASAENWLEIVGVFGGITYLGAKEWEWGSSSFKFNEEGWFDMNAGSGGADKLGHLYSSYLMTEFLTHRMSQKGYSVDSSAKYSAYLSWGLMLYVEIFDGYSADHGFSYEDLIANTTGIGVSYLKTKYPDVLGDTLDLRIEYSPSKGMKGFHPITDYSGMKYLAVAKLSGIDIFKNTPLKYLELQAGYYSRGFKKDDRPYTDFKTTEAFIGISLNLSELIFKPYRKNLGKVGQYADTITQYIQVPGISMRENIKSRSKLVKP
tara:strand:+ start:6591 stop:7484 length:894 start_codon:yes stop_codon:yes gene_type:complete